MTNQIETLSAAVLVLVVGLGVGCSLRKLASGDSMNDGGHADAQGGTGAGGRGPGAGRGGSGGRGPGGGGGSGGQAGVGGAGTGGVGTGGASVGGAAGGARGAGGGAGTGGVGTGGASGGGAGGGLGGAGGMTTSCTANATQCSGDAKQTCGNNGQWGLPVACPPRQICTGPVGSASCACKLDTVCSTVGSTCANPSTLAACSQDALTCFYEVSSSLCTNGACSGAPGAASCCTNACTNGATQCLSGTSLQTCGVAASGCTAPASSNCATGTVCERYASAACLDPNWAEWPLTNSQVDVTAGAPNPESYTDNGDGTITDNVTKLMWQKAVAPGTLSQANALTYCATTLSGTNLGGHNDWRLPSVIELVSIVDFGIVPPNINATYFPATPATPADYFASSSAWVVTFNGGGTVINDFAPLLNVRCVR